MRESTIEKADRLRIAAEGGLMLKFVSPGRVGVPDDIVLRPAQRDDVPTILAFIRELAVFEKLEHEAIATPALMEQALFGERPAAEVVIAEADGQPAGFVLFFTTFSTFASATCAGVHTPVAAMRASSLSRAACAASGARSGRKRLGACGSTASKAASACDSRAADLPR